MFFFVFFFFQAEDGIRDIGVTGVQTCALPIFQGEGLSYDAGGDWWNKNFLWILAEEIGFDALRERVKRPLAGLRIAPFYGCYIVRPSKRLGFDEHPQRDAYLGLLIEALGGQAVDYAGARKCCGFPVITMNRTTSLRQAGRHLADAID